MRVAYLDASAVVKLFKPEAESPQLAEALAGCELWMASELVTVEAGSAARRAGGESMAAIAESVVARVELIPCTEAIRVRAAASFSGPLRALDAIHAATALSVRDHVDAVYVYDAGLSSALVAEGLTVASPGRLIRLAVRAPAADSEQVLAALLELAPSGVEQVDGAETVEFAVYGAPGELPELAEGEAEVGGIRVVVSGSAVPDDWEERWKRFHTPVLIGSRLYLRPPWEEAAARPGVLDLVIDPGRAFGTGAHATTRLCLELLLDVADGQPGSSFCDLGCGSGVLAVAAARLGFAPVTALDSDQLAVEATLINACENGVTLDRVERANLRDEPSPRADVVAANLMRPLLLRVAELMRGRPRALIVSGLLDHEADEVSGAFAPMAERRRLSSQGWTALVLG